MNARVLESKGLCSASSKVTAKSMALTASVQEGEGQESAEAFTHSAVAFAT